MLKLKKVLLLFLCYLIIPWASFSRDDCDLFSFPEKFSSRSAWEEFARKREDPENIIDFTKGTFEVTQVKDINEVLLKTDMKVQDLEKRGILKKHLGEIKVRENRSF